MKAILLLMVAATHTAQQPPEFEAASIKPNNSGGPGYGMRGSSGQIELQNYPLRRLIQMAYRLRDYNYSGPSWLDSVCFDIVAKMPAGGKQQQFPEMMQALLVERFKLAVHREQKETNGLALVVDKKGPRIQPVEPGPGGGTAWGPNMVQGNKITMAGFADLLSGALDRPVKDLTELPGIYDIKIRWLPDGPAPADSSDLAPSVYAAVQEQLGLRLQAQKVSIEILVVDRVERTPAEN